MGYCRIHGSYVGDGCRYCRDAEERAASDRSELLEKLDELAEAQAETREELAFAINNPGDFPCPHCKLRTLKAGAQRCPRCQKDIEPPYWDRVLEAMRELRAAKAAREAKAAAERAEWAAQNREVWSRQLPWLVYLWALPGLSIATAWLVAEPLYGVKLDISPTEAAFGLTIMAIPVVNWIVLLLLMFFAKDDYAGFHALVF